ncbi:MAG TPA: GerMN domain-containing protein [Fimbriimonadaceae bacterium]|jgi:hypothetical protein
MPSKKSRKPGPSKAAFVVVILICLTAVGALAKYVQMGHSIVPAFEHRQDTSQDEASVTRPRRDRRELKQDEDQPQAQGPFVYTPIASSSTKIGFVKTPVSSSGSDAKVYVINKFLETTKIADPSAKLLSVTVNDGVASLYFNAEMNKTVGTDDEQTLLEGILKNLSQFPDIKSALFFADGKQIETFGNSDLTEAQPVTVDDDSQTPTTHSQKR